jgi:hypothetical protein
MRGGEADATFMHQFASVLGAANRVGIVIRAAVEIVVALDLFAKCTWNSSQLVVESERLLAKYEKIEKDVTKPK